ncbi:MAG TPA: hypothetical protein VE953_03315 [Terriglobales bacterium]|nr:hypothetical protein [Terriglobales bacterium]
MNANQRSPLPWRRMVQQVAVVTVPLLLVVVLRIPYQGLALRLWLVALGAIGLGLLTERALAGRAVHDVPGLRMPWGWWRRPRGERVRALEELEHAVDFSLGTAFDVHYRLRPHVRRIAAYRLGLRGVSLDRQPRRAAALLGPEAWDLARADRPEPEDRNARGLDLAHVTRVVEGLDAL